MLHLKNIHLKPEEYPTLEQYPFSLPLFSNTTSLSFSRPITFFVGENGSGKSTLLEAIARAAGIHIWQTGMTSRHQVNNYEKSLYRYLKLDWNNAFVPGSFFGAQSFKDFAGILEEWAATDPGQLKYFGGKSLISQSHGQSLMSFFKSRYQLEGLYLLDEPETALSPKTQVELLGLLNQLSVVGHAQFIIATHSPILLAAKDAMIYNFDQSPIATINYSETAHFKVYHDFLLTMAEESAVSSKSSEKKL